MTDRSKLIMDLGFAIQDPCGEGAMRLAGQVLTLIENRDDVECVALISELRCLLTKYPRVRIRPKATA